MSFNFPKDVGIIGIDVYFPTTYVLQEELEQHDGVTSGKYTQGLGQKAMAFCNECEDVCSMSLTIVKRLLTRYQIDVSKIGRLEVGTESHVDRAKAVKTTLMQLWPNQSGNLAGVDTLNACFGATAALHNAIDWIESRSWDGRLALVVAADIAVYPPGPARPTGGAGAIAMLIGPNAPLVIDAGWRGYYMEHAYDFYKGQLDSEYPMVDGRFSIQCYFRALDQSYRHYQQSVKRHHHQISQPLSGDSAQYSKSMNGNTSAVADSLVESSSVRLSRVADYVLFHTPYSRLVQKAFARLIYNDFLDAPEEYPEELQRFKNIPVEESYTNRDLETAFVTYSQSLYKSKVESSLFLSRELGNIYCGSIYSCLLSLLSLEPADQLLNKRVLFFSYGSGIASSVFSLVIRESPQSIADIADIKNRISQRTKSTPQEYTQTMEKREQLYLKCDYKPSTDSINALASETYYLNSVDKSYRRSYSYKE